MRILNFIIFFSVFLSIYGFVNYYIFIRGWQCLPSDSRIKILYLIGFIILSIAFILGRIFEKFWLCPVSEALVWIGSFWLAAMLYFLLIVLFVDILRIINHWIPIFSMLTNNIAMLKYYAFSTSFTIVLIIIIFGHINASRPIIKTINLTVQKKTNLDSLNIVAASDIHLGTIIGNGKFNKIVSKINSLNPDIILLPGDIVDEDLGPVIKENMGEGLTKLKAKYGVIAITGNHEYIGGVEAASKYLKDHNLIVLRDSVYKVADSIYIIGREDRARRQFTSQQRKPLKDLMDGIDKNSPTILLDHQPFGLNEAVDNGIDLQISGHTHHGQLWPMNYVTEAIYEVSWGYLKKENTHFYVSSGVGTWGPPVRLGSRSEIVNIKLKFIKE